MWIFCGGMKRSGSTLQYQLASALVEAAGVGMRITWFPSAEFPAVRERYAGVRLWKVFKSHDCTREIACEITDEGALGLYVYRDLRDVIASQMQMSRLSFDRLWSLGFLDECVANDRCWTDLARVCVVQYEDIIYDVPRLVQLIAAHLRIPLPLAAGARLASDYTLAAQKQRIEGFTRNRSGRRVEAVGNDLVFDQHSLLHFNHINTGACGAWRQLLTPHESARVESKFRAWLRSKGYLRDDNSSGRPEGRGPN